MKISDEMHAWVLNNYSNIHTYGHKKVGTRSIDVLEKIWDALNPYHIIYMPGEIRIESKEEGDAASVVSL
jgi:hypothetical protein